MDEFAMGSSNENSAFFTTKNPWDLDKVPGGSSGGSAAVVSADLAAFALGSDSGGSIRQPASFCGVVGLRPTYGLVSRYGMIAFASSLDQIGPLTKTVEDCAYVLNVISGYDELDPTSVQHSDVDYLDFLYKKIKGLKIGVPTQYFNKGLDKEVELAVKKAILEFEQLGADIVQISLPHSEYALAAYHIIASVEASSNLAKFDGIRFGNCVQQNNLTQLYKKNSQYRLWQGS